MTYAHKPYDVPRGEHYAILIPNSITIPGDERSRTHPGHGYPEHTVEAWDYLVFNIRERWEAEILRLTKAGQAFVPLKSNHVTLSVETTVSIHVFD